MKKTILSMFLALIAMNIISSCKEKKLVKTDAELRADSIKQAKQDSILSVENFKKESIATIEELLKKKISSDPNFGKVLETDDNILNDSIYFTKSRIVIKNDFGAEWQYDDFWFAFCRRTKDEPHMLYWTTEEKCQKGMDYIVGNEKTIISSLFFLFQPTDYHIFMDKVCSNFLSSVDEMLK